MDGGYFELTEEDLELVRDDLDLTEDDMVKLRDKLAELSENITETLMNDKFRDVLIEEVKNILNREVG